MNPTTMGTRLILAALFLSAGVLSAHSNTDPKPASSSHPGTLLSAPASVTVADSPLVRAAKASRRSGIKPSTVITNDTLVRSGGHFTTTNAQKPVPHIAGPKPQTDEEWLAEARKKNADAAAAVAAERKTELEKKLAAAGRAQLTEGDTPEINQDGPQPADGPIQTMKPTAPPSMETTKPPM